jgi:hypothetical protein
MEPGMKAIVGCLILAAFVSPAIAANEYYVVQDPTTKKCFVIDKPIANSSVKLIGEDKPYVTRDAADAAMKTAKECAR